MRKPKFEIGERVYHVTEGSTKGIVLDIRYSYYHDNNEYLVAFSHDTELWCLDREISKNQTWL